MYGKFLKLLTSIVYIFLGLMLILNPKSITNIIVVALGLACICYAAINFLRYAKNRNKLNLIIGIVLAALGLFLVLQPVLKLEFYDKIFGVILDIFLIFMGLLLIKENFSKTVRTKYIEMGLGLVVITFGIITLIKPSISFISIIIGFVCLVIGGMQIYKMIKEKI